MWIWTLYSVFSIFDTYNNCISSLLQEIIVGVFFSNRKVKLYCKSSSKSSFNVKRAIKNSTLAKWQTSYMSAAADGKHSMKSMRCNINKQHGQWFSNKLNLLLFFRLRMWMHQINSIVEHFWWNRIIKEQTHKRKQMKRNNEIDLLFLSFFFEVLCFFLKRKYRDWLTDWMTAKSILADCSQQS